LSAFCGLAADARIARGAGFSVAVGAGDRRRTETLVAVATVGADCLVKLRRSRVAPSPKERARSLALSQKIGTDKPSAI
jgi:hypothetical protein